MFLKLKRDTNKSNSSSQPRRSASARRKYLKAPIWRWSRIRSAGCPNTSVARTNARRRRRIVIAMWVAAHKVPRRPMQLLRRNCVFIYNSSKSTLLYSLRDASNRPTAAVGTPPNKPTPPSGPRQQRPGGKKGKGRRWRSACWIPERIHWWLLYCWQENSCRYHKRWHLNSELLFLLLLDWPKAFCA